MGTLGVSPSGFSTISPSSTSFLYKLLIVSGSLSNESGTMMPAAFIAAFFAIAVSV
eukprot:CAMPEP_0179310874 /NCGR_PEP_ID=MMETSP0797-20121207/52395_1 /TAXON_ID=47934 /ORGANISM="Dinophysis acuminata, Strain DAEP01" /LENGTH=55 /DNA_ID=CAMNT_0021020629 /DNA_START=13 /DNA_END=176 /DNA_ORIENTATION=+